MKYHFVATQDLECLDVEALVAHHGGRNFISEAEVLSWFENLDLDRPVVCESRGLQECDGAYN